MTDPRKPGSDKVSLAAEEPDQLPTGEGPSEGAATQDGGGQESGAAEEPLTVQRLQQKVDELEERYEREHDLHLRAAAELKNYRRRVAQQQAQQLQYANESLFASLLPVLDHCQLAVQAALADDPGDELSQGMRMAYQQLMEVLARFGLEPIEATGEQFDHDRHEAVAREPVPADHPAVGAVIGQLRRGYRLHDRVLRPAQVEVAVAFETNSVESNDDTLAECDSNNRESA